MVSVIYSEKKKTVLVKDGVNLIHKFDNAKLEDNENGYKTIIDFYSTWRVLCEIPKKYCVVIYLDEAEQSLKSLPNNDQSVQGSVATGDDSSNKAKSTKAFNE